MKVQVILQYFVSIQSWIDILSILRNENPDRFITTQLGSGNVARFTKENRLFDPKRTNKDITRIVC